MFSPGESQGRGSLVGFRLWGRTESDRTSPWGRKESDTTATEQQHREEGHVITEAEVGVMWESQGLPTTARRILRPRWIQHFPKWENLLSCSLIHCSILGCRFSLLTLGHRLQPKLMKKTTCQADILIYDVDVCHLPREEVTAVIRRLCFDSS